MIRNAIKSKDQISNPGSYDGWTVYDCNKHGEFIKGCYVDLYKQTEEFREFYRDTGIERFYFN
jgi:hypothetical protein